MNERPAEIATRYEQKAAECERLVQVISFGPDKTAMERIAWQWRCLAVEYRKRAAA